MRRTASFFFFLFISLFLFHTTDQSIAQNMHGAARDFDSDPRIIGGRPALIEHWPGQVAIRTVGNGTADYGCGGTLISETVVLTAAHCLTGVSQAKDKRYYSSGYEVEVVIGVQNLKNVPVGNVRKISNMVIHSGFKKASAGNDIALLFLDKPWKKGFITLSETTQSDPTLDWVTPVMVAGYGVQKEKTQALTYEDSNKLTFYSGSDKLLEAAVPLTPLPECKEAYKKKKKSIDISDDQICAGLTEGGRDACQGDSGGPLVAFDRRGYPYQIGIVSWGSGCARASSYGLYTRVSHHSAWIKKHVPDVQFLKQDNVPQITANRNILVERLFAQLNKELEGISNKVAISIEPGQKVKLGDSAKFNIDSSVAGKLVLIDINTEGKVSQIYPNPFSKNSIVAKSTTFTLPDNSSYEFDVQPPVGVSKLISLVVPENFNMEALDRSRGAENTKTFGVRAALPYFQNLLNLIRIARGTDRVDQEKGMVVKPVSSDRKDLQNWGLGFYDYEVIK